ncbi:MAG: response regulator [Pirellulales bacterium]|nr:response regulator [Pirellulales bacterium]
MRHLISTLRFKCTFTAIDSRSPADPAVVPGLGFNNALVSTAALKGDSRLEDERPVEVLLIEDSPSDAKLVVEGFRNWRTPNRVHVVEDGGDALDFVHRKPPFADAPRPDLIMIDLDIPKVHGLVVLATLKNNAELQQIPVIVLTSSNIEEEVQRALDMKASRYLRKPSDLDGFLQLIASVERDWLTQLARADKHGPASTEHRKNQ